MKMAPARKKKLNAFRRCVAVRLVPLLIAFLALPIAFCAASQPLGLAGERVLIINHTAGKWLTARNDVGRYVEQLIHHFTTHTLVVDADNYQSGSIGKHTKVVFIGHDGVAPPPDPVIQDLAGSELPIMWLGFGVSHFTAARSGKLGFSTFYWQDASEPLTLHYRGMQYETELSGYNRIFVTDPSTRVWSVLHIASNPAPIPFALSSENIWYVNATPKVWSTPDPDAPTLVLADVLHEYFATNARRLNRAVIRLEDVSTNVPPTHFWRYVEYLAELRVPYAIGVIPNQRLADGSIDPLGENLSIVNGLRFAQRNRATIVLHGFFHTFGEGEDFEFWDPELNRPLANESKEFYVCKVAMGIRLLRNLGLEPRLWETPHYAGSPLAYQVFGEYFSHVIENRVNGSSPYSYGPDAYGQVVIPENLGFVDANNRSSVDVMLKRARLLQIVRDAWAVGFIHPSVVPVDWLKDLVTGLRRLNYTFADLSELPTTVRLDYRPGRYEKTANFIAAYFGINVRKMSRWFRTGTTAIGSGANSPNGTGRCVQLLGLQTISH